MKLYNKFGVATLVVAGSLGVAIAQTSTTGQTNSTDNASQMSSTSQTNSAASTSAAATTNTGTNGTYATGKPLEQQSKEGFWGHVNPMARKKWVHRQIDPVRDRANELDQLQAKNANDIKDVDGRATAGISKAMTAAGAADAHAGDAANRADKANSLALSADGKTTTLNGTVQNLDQYQQVSSTTVPFVKGRTALTTKTKASLDEVATALAAEKGYIVEVQGYSRGGVASSQAMADSVVRYLVTAHQVPIYRIYRTGLGNQKKGTQSEVATNPDEKPLTNGVRVTVLHNSLATMASSSGTPTGSVNSGSSTTTTTPATTTSATPTTPPASN